MSLSPSIVWFRDDLRIAGQPALHAAVLRGAPLLCVYIRHDGLAGTRALGGASRWWLHHSLSALAGAMSRIGAELHLLAGDPRELLPALAAASGASHVFWTRRYGGAEIAIDSSVKQQLAAQGVEASSFNGQLLREPWEVKSKAGEPLKVFTPYWRASLALGEPAPPATAPQKLAGASWPARAPARAQLTDWAFLPQKPDWAAGLRETFTPGEAGARQRLAHFIDHGLPRYGQERDFAGENVTSLLAPHLRFGEISPQQIWHAVRHGEAAGRADSRSVAKFFSELGWREFSSMLLFNNPQLARKNFNPRFDAFPWEQADPTSRAASRAASLAAWRQGRTGYPMVDAGMRELWRTGYMHNRVRMIAASFLIKHLMIDWREGEEWFWDTLCDADPANNAASWQWVAGSGADAAPYFRIFNPVLQGAKFDPDGRYVRRWIPELAKLDTKFIHAPWQAPQAELAKAGIRLGETYPRPIVEHAAARERALAAFATIRAQ
ncbi:MAG: deoxyribodipyrimidine photo-lyase [Alphaproteobacteria bacterium]|nr:deoxyribodipyrimidine photo-lyase [Alphaproteobacteria bacterium]